MRRSEEGCVVRLVWHLVDGAEEILRNALANLTYTIVGTMGDAVLFEACGVYMVF